MTPITSTSTLSLVKKGHPGEPQYLARTTDEDGGGISAGLQDHLRSGLITSSHRSHTRAERNPPLWLRFGTATLTFPASPPVMGAGCFPSPSPFGDSRYDLGREIALEQKRRTANDVARESCRPV